MGRRHVLIAAILVLLIGLCGCGKTVSKQNMIAPKELTEDQREIVDLLSIPSRQEILIFSYDADAEYKNMDVWVEIYKDGELIEPHAGGISMMDPLDHFKGDLAVAITQSPDFQWTFIVSEGGSRVTSASEYAPHMDEMGRAFGPILDPVNIEDGEEIILYTSVFSADNTMRVFDEKTLEEEPERLKEYDYAHIIKCRFSK